MRKEDLILVGKFPERYNYILKTDIPTYNIYYTHGLEAHLRKHRHFSCIKYLKELEQIIKNPDYIGVNPYEHGDSFELVKIYDRNVLVGIKLSVEGEYLYVSTIHELQPSKLKRRIYSGRLRQVKGVDKIS